MPTRVGTHASEHVTVHDWRSENFKVADISVFMRGLGLELRLPGLYDRSLFTC